MEYRNTPLSSAQFSPLALLMLRSLRSILPTSKEKLKPRVVSPDNVRVRLKLCRTAGKKLCRRKTKPLEPLEIRDSALVQNMHNKTWQQAVMIEKHSERSYSFRTTDGATYRRNRHQKIKTNECIPKTPEVKTHIPEETSLSEPQQQTTSISEKTGQTVLRQTSLFTLR